MNRVLSIVLALVVIINSTMAQARSFGTPKSQQDQISAKQYHCYKVDFRAGEAAQVLLHSYGMTYLSVVVFDKDGNVVAEANDHSGDAFANWVPNYNGEFFIFVVNEAPVNNSYHISTN